MSDSELTQKKNLAYAGLQLSQSGAGRLYSFKDDSYLSASLMIISFPVAADVEIDGVFYGGAGERILVPVGMRHISVSLPGYCTWEKTLMLRQEPMTIRAQLKRSGDFRIINE
ncbi:MAG: PEGA domain-containing protein [Cellvibrionaceae bacterium]|nr:PEGA domain-containing protein [Cellvibrionaceae bacterium]